VNSRKMNDSEIEAMIPTKLKHDAIMEAVFEIRFHSSDLPEVVVGRLADREEWAAFSKSQQPISNLPAQFRRADPNLRFEPLLQLQDQTSGRLVRIGEQVISYHVMAPYCGWTQFHNELDALISWLFKRFTDFKVLRLGLRYIDALRSDLHSITDLSSLNLKVSVGEKEIGENFMLHFFESLSDSHDQIIRVTSKKFVSGPIPDGATVVTDIDIFTPDSYETCSAGYVGDWLNKAHAFGKTSFFNLLPEAVLQALAES